MKFPCPACRQPVTANPPRPGRFTPACPKCGVAFALQITVTALPPAPDETANSTDPEDLDRTRPTVAETPQQPVADLNTTLPTDARPDADDTADTEATSGYIPGDTDGKDETVTAVSSQAPAAEAKADSGGEPDAVRGYELLKQLGRGGMGTVWLARQVSLDRPVALKVVNPKWASDPVFIARFVREAYAAAQLTHHNVVQIYDLGRDADLNYFSMELVRGQSLGDLLRKSGPVEPAAAVGFIIQAARGLKFAHDRGMVHRDVKPDNLLVNADGVVKVADLGLVKTRDLTAEQDRGAADDGADTGAGLRGLSGITRAGAVMGSPMYMAPEQGQDATSVDHRADVYSLGCTLYALLAGKAPFHGTTAIEVISKHRTEPPPPLHRLAPKVPAELGRIVDRSLAKSPAERFQSMDDMAKALTDWQAARGGGPARPTEQQLAAFEGLTRQLTAAPTARLKRLIGLIGSVVGIVAAVVLLPISGIAAGAVALGILAAVVAGFVTAGVFTGSHLFAKLREWAFGSRWVDWLTAAAAVILFAAGLYFAGLHLVGLPAIVIGGGLGFAYGYFLARPVHDHEQETKDAIEGVTKRLRLAGMDEDGVRRFVVENAGDRWERVYELLYGYPAKVQARGLYAEQVANRPKHAGWRDAIVWRIDAALDARKQVRAKQLLKAVEAARLKAEGVDITKATLLAEDAADDLVQQGREIQAANADAKKRVNVREMMARFNRKDATPRPRANPLVRLGKAALAVPLDPRLRLLVGAALIVGALMWVRQNSGGRLEVAATGVQSTAEASQKALGLWEVVKPLVLTPEKAKPLQLGWLPAGVTGFFDTINPLVAGVLVLLSTLAGRGRTVFVVMVAAGVAFAGHKLGVPIPEVGPLKPSHLTGAVGLVAGVVGLVVLGRW